MYVFKLTQLTGHCMYCMFSGTCFGVLYSGCTVYIVYTVCQVEGGAVQIQQVVLQLLLLFKIVG